MREQLEHLAAADAHLGCAVPLPRVSLPPVRWVDVYACGPGAVEICWNLDDSRAGAPGRVALWAGQTPPDDRGLGEGEDLDGLVLRRATLDEAQASLRPVTELRWTSGRLHLRLTAQGPWALEDVLALARSVT